MITKEPRSPEQSKPGQIEFNQFASRHYLRLLSYVRKSVFKGSDNFFGHTPEDVLNQAFVAAATFLEEKPDKVQELLESEKGFENYFYTIILRKSKDIFCDLCRFDVKRRAAIGEGMRQLVSEGYSEQGFEMVEKRNMMDGLNRSMKALLRMLEEGVTVRQIIETLDMTSVRQYYKARATLLEDIERLENQ